MAWFKIDDRFHSHPKIVQAGNAAVGAWVRMGAWCADHLTDGHIPGAVAAMFASDLELDALHQVGLLSATGTGWLIPDWHDFNPSADEVRASRQKRSAAASDAGKASATKRATNRQRNVNDGGNEPSTKQATKQATSVQRGRNADSTPHPHPHPLKTTTTAAPVDNCPSFADSVAAQFALIGARQAEQRGIKIGNMHGYLHALEQAALSHPDMQRLLAQFPHAPADVIAAALHGDKHSLGYFDKPAPVIQLHSEHHHVD